MKIYRKFASGSHSDMVIENVLRRHSPEIIPIWKEKIDIMNDAVNRMFATMNGESISETENGPRKKEFKKIMDELKRLDKEIETLIDPAKKIADQERQTQIDEQSREKKETESRYKNIHKIKEKLETLVRKRFPITDNPYLAGYIMSNGDMLNFSLQGMIRDLDHRQVGEAFPSKIPIDSGTDGMWQFMIATGAIRINLSRKFISLDIRGRITYDQKERIVDIIFRNDVTEGVINKDGKDIDIDRYNFESVIEKL